MNVRDLAEVLTFLLPPRPRSLKWVGRQDPLTGATVLVDGPYLDAFDVIRARRRFHDRQPSLGYAVYVGEPPWWRKS